MEWYSVDVKINDEILRDILSDFVFSIGCKGIEDLDETTFEDASGLRLFFEEDEDPQMIINSLRLFFTENELEEIPEMKYEKIPNINWREEWKKTYSPVEAGKFIVVPAWQEIESDKIKILIEPKMAFGTGTHETTKLMLEEISKHDFTGKKVFEAGSGSGILSIASVLNGAESVTAVDIDEESYDNCKENAHLNKVDTKIHTKFTDDSDYDVENTYDIVLANINRIVLDELIPKFKKIVKPKGLIILSGILIEENARMYQKVHDIGGLITDGYYEMNEWCCIRLVKD
ncbi:MAG: 50S ribosomal protein L11 methyltransferase [Candidatus Delongbacteria bacterium]|nr:50S ribosomal protein L11 methyltransferase [Candidatus Delongbacteria bacterium]MCG2760556.1 50S ribosomal protein L11 methyltransferase [Candidatus Delongbacteria bacterium]